MPKQSLDAKKNHNTSQSLQNICPFYESDQYSTTHTSTTDNQNTIKNVQISWGNAYLFNKATKSHKSFISYTPLHWAAYHGNEDEVEALIKSGADINNNQR